jgi:hypothetical protein
VVAEAAWWRSSELLGQALHGGVGDKVNHARRQEFGMERQGKRRLPKDKGRGGCLLHRALGTNNVSGAPRSTRKWGRRRGFSFYKSRTHRLVVGLDGALTPSTYTKAAYTEHLH